MVTFWQAMLVASRKVRMALVSLCTLMRHKKLKKGMLEDVTIAAGQLTNCLVSIRMPRCYLFNE